MATSRRHFILASAAAAAFPLRAQSQKLKVHISVDMEGVAGVVTADQLAPGAFEYERFRTFMTNEAVAAVLGAKDAGATEIVVADSHGNGENLLIEKFPADVRLVRGWPRKLGMMAGVDASFDAAVFIGYHASTSNSQGVRAHTFSSAKLTRVALNGTAVTEGAFNAAIAGHFGVPVVLVAGDNMAVAEVRSLVGNIEGAETKRALSFHSADTMTPDAACAMIREKTRAAVARRKDFAPYKLSLPVTLDVSFKHYRPVELLGYLKDVERVDSHTIRYRAANMLGISDFVMFLTHYDPNLEP